MKRVLLWALALALVGGVAVPTTATDSYKKMGVYFFADSETSVQGAINYFPSTGLTFGTTAADRTVYSLRIINDSNALAQVRVYSSSAPGWPTNLYELVDVPPNTELPLTGHPITGVRLTAMGTGTVYFLAEA